MSHTENRNPQNQRRRFNVEKWRSYTILLSLSFLVMLQYQNCAPNSMQAAQGQGFGDDGSMPVSVIDHVNTDGLLRFNAKAVEIHTDVQAVVLKGVCSSSQNGSVLGWSVNDLEGGYELGRGYSVCQDGQFEIELAPTQQLECGHDYGVSAYIGNGEASELTISRRCEADSVVEASPAMKASVRALRQTSSCVVERARDGQGGCSLVCYSIDGIVEAKQDLEPARCGH